MTFRKIIFWSHLLAGCIAGIVILIMSVTGVALAYEKQIVAWAERGYRVEKPPAVAGHLPVETLLARAREANSGSNPASITMRSDPGAPAAVGFGRMTVLVNPYTGDVLGRGATSVRAFMTRMIEWHRYLGMAGEKRPLGKAITGACNLAFLFLVCSGFYLWFPRKWSAGAVKSVVSFGRGLSGKARDWNWHNGIGFWSAVPLFFVVATGLFFNYAWANTALSRLTGSEPPASKPPPRSTRGAGSGERPSGTGLEGLNGAWQRAEKEAGDWRSMTARLGSSPATPISFNVERGTVGQPHRKLQFTVDRSSLEILSRETYESYNLGRKARLWIRWIHTGEAGGLLGQGVAMIASAGGAVLVWTGLSLALRRFLGRNRS
jgi:uncharacterized iron-regulated membrane protein